MSDLTAFSISEKAQCLAIQKVKARLIKDSFINQGSIAKEAHVARQVVRYTTLLSEKMLEKITTEEVRQFRKNVQDYCTQSERLTQLRKSKNAKPQRINVSVFLNHYKNEAKMSLLNKKKRRKTSNASKLSAIASQQRLKTEGKQEVPRLDVKKAKDDGCNESRASQFHINGRGMNSQIINLLEKLDQIQSIERLRKRREHLYQEYDVEDHARHLKKEQQRLNTALQSHQRVFKPLGKIKRDLRYNSQIMERGSTVTRALSLKTSSRSQAVAPKPIKKTSINLEAGLPSLISNKPKYQSTKRSEGFIPINEEVQPIISSNMYQNTQPPFDHEAHMFLGNIYQ